MLTLIYDSAMARYYAQRYNVVSVANAADARVTFTYASAIMPDGYATATNIGKMPFAAAVAAAALMLRQRVSSAPDTMLMPLRYFSRRVMHTARGSTNALCADTRYAMARDTLMLMMLP